MAETLLSPGVLARENDLSAITAQPIQAGAAIIGPTVKGPVGIPTLVTSYSEYAQAFGTTFLSASLQQEFLTSNSAYNYFNNGGTTLLVTRVVSGSFTSATSTNISGSGVAVATSFTLKTFGEGEIMNSSGSEVDGALVSGSSDNLRWEVAGFSTSSGTFSLLIRRGDDTTSEKTVLESYANLSLDPTAPNYISKVIGDSYKTVNTSDTTPYVQDNGTFPNRSRYVYVSAVNSKTPQYFDNNGDFKSEYTASLPAVASGSFENATGQVYFNTAGAAFNEKITTAANIQGLNNTNYTTSIDLLSNQDEYNFNSITSAVLLLSSIITLKAYKPCLC